MSMSEPTASLGSASMDISEPESDDDITFEDILERPEDTERGLSIIEKLGMRLAN